MSKYDRELGKYAKGASQDDVNKISSKLGGMNKGPIAKVWENVQALWAMAKDPAAAWGSKAIAIGALLYLVSPIDLVPDVIPVLGLSDDAAVIAAAIAKLASDLQKYKK